MIKSIQFHNFKVLQDATLPLGRFTLIVGPNGSGKSTALQALQAVTRTTEPLFQRFMTAGLPSTDGSVVDVVLQWGVPHEGVVTIASWHPGDVVSPLDHTGLSDGERRSLDTKLARIRI